MTVPSEWTDQARVTSPDGMVDAVVATADPCVGYQIKSTVTKPARYLPTQPKAGADDQRLLCVRLCPKGQPIAREAPYFTNGRRFLMDRVTSKSILVGGPAPALKVRWKNNDTLIVTGPVDNLEFSTDKAWVEHSNGQREVAVLTRLEDARP